MTSRLHVSESKLIVLDAVTVSVKRCVGMVMYFLELSSLGVTATPVLLSNLCFDLLPGTMARMAEPAETPAAWVEGRAAEPATELCAELWPKMRSKRVLVEVVVVAGLDAEASPAVEKTVSGIKDTFSPPNSLGRPGTPSS